MRSPTCQRATIAVHLLLSAAPGCCARLLRRAHCPPPVWRGLCIANEPGAAPPPNWRGQLRYAVPRLAGRVMACLGKSLVQLLELCWDQAPAGRLAVFDRALDTVRFG